MYITSFPYLSLSLALTLFLPNQPNPTQPIGTKMAAKFKVLELMYVEYIQNAAKSDKAYFDLKNNIKTIPVLQSHVTSISSNLNSLTDNLFTLTKAIGELKYRIEEDKILHLEAAEYERTEELRRKFFAEHASKKEEVENTRRLRYEYELRKKREELRKDLEEKMTQLESNVEVRDRSLSKSATLALSPQKKSNTNNIPYNSVAVGAVPATTITPATIQQSHRKLEVATAVPIATTTATSTTTSSTPVKSTTSSTIDSETTSPAKESDVEHDNVGKKDEVNKADEIDKDEKNEENEGKEKKEKNEKIEKKTNQTKNGKKKSK